jgi:hypothetical protein
MTFRITTFSVVTLSVTTHRRTLNKRYLRLLLCSVMLNGIIMLNGIMLNVNNTKLLSVAFLIGMLTVLIENVAVLTVAAPLKLICV